NNNRLHTPLIKRRNDQVPVSWDNALNAAAQHLKKIISASGPDSVAGLGSLRASNEDNFVFQKFFRTTIGTNNIDSPAHFNYRNLERGLEETLGFPCSCSSFTDLEKTEVIFVIGSDVRAEMPPASLKIMKATRFHGAKLFVANPISTKLEKFSNLDLRYRPGTELFLITGIIKAIIENGWENQDFIKENVSNFKNLKKSLKSITIQKIAETTSVPAEKIITTAENIAKKETGCIVFGYNVFTHAQAKEVVANLVNLALLTGKVGRKGCGLIPVITKNNCQGMLDMGVMPDLLPGYQKLEDRKAFEKLWGKSLPKKPGKTAEEMLTAIEKGEIKALYIMGCNPLMDFPEPDRWAEALEKLEWLTVQDVFQTEVAEKAHYVFPAATFAEKEGTFTNGERRVQKFTAAIEPYRNALPDWKIIQNLSQLLGYDMNYSHPSEIMEEIASLIPQYKGLTYEKLGRKGIQWPLQDGEDSPYIPLKDLKLSFSSLTFQEPKKVNSGKFYMLTGTTFFHSGTLSTYAQGPNILGNKAWVEVNEEDAKSIGLNEGDNLNISSANGSISAPVKISSVVPRGVIFVPYHFREAKVNKVISRKNYAEVAITKG
ncbi:MAG: formate dehydrogenase subunit alpha, partial [Candidatus Wolframiiraptor sp.]